VLNGRLVLLYEIVVTFATKKPDSFCIRPIRMTILNLEVADGAVFVIPHVIYDVEFLLIVITTIMRRPHSITVDRFFRH